MRNSTRPRQGQPLGVSLAETDIEFLRLHYHIALKTFLKRALSKTNCKGLKNIVTRKYLRSLFEMKFILLPFSHCGSRSICVYCRIRSTLVICEITSAVCRTPNWSIPVKMRVCDIASPTLPENIVSATKEQRACIKDTKIVYRTDSVFVNYF